MTHDERVYHHLYVDAKSPLENAERIASLEELVEELQAENAKLREERREYQATIDSLVDECTDHKAENAKLRELVEDMWLHSYCSIAETREEDEHHIESVIDSMRELGIEVTE